MYEPSIAVGARRWLAIAIALTLLTASGCGFKLRGALELPPGQNTLYVNAPSDVYLEIGNFLEGSQAKVVGSPDGASVILNVTSATYDRRVLTVDPDTGKEREFELSLNVRFNALDGDGKTLVDAQSVTLLRDYVFDSDAVIGASREEVVLRREMLRDAVQQLLLRLRSAIENA